MDQTGEVRQLIVFQVHTLQREKLTVQFDTTDGTLWQFELLDL